MTVVHTYFYIVIKASWSFALAAALKAHFFPAVSTLALSNE